MKDIISPWQFRVFFFFCFFFGGGVFFSKYKILELLSKRARIWISITVLISFLEPRPETTRTAFRNYLASKVENLEERDFATFRNEAVKLLSGIQSRTKKNTSHLHFLGSHFHIYVENTIKSTKRKWKQISLLQNWSIIQFPSKFPTNSPSKSCSLHPWPTFLVLDYLDILITPITLIINASLEQGKCQNFFKQAHVTPILKKNILRQRSF